jgi:hypothetical protein
LKMTNIDVCGDECLINEFDNFYIMYYLIFKWCFSMNSQTQVCLCRTLSSMMSLILSKFGSNSWFNYFFRMIINYLIGIFQLVCIQRHKFVLLSVICCCWLSLYWFILRLLLTPILFIARLICALKLETTTISLYRQIKCDFLPLDSTKHCHGIFKILIITTILHFL